MVENRIRAMLAEKNMSAAALSKTMPGMGKVCMSFIVNGIALPTREGMTAMCGTLDCLPTDLYDEAELNLNITGSEMAESPLHIEDVAEVKATKAEEMPAIPLNSLESPVREKAERRDSSGHEGQERVFFWFRLEEKAALVKAVKGLDYRSVAEWMREMYRQTLKQYAALRLDGKTLHDLIPPIVEPVPPATNKS